jgi:hypothetical protein
VVVVEDARGGWGAAPPPGLFLSFPSLRRGRGWGGGAPARPRARRATLPILTLFCAAASSALSWRWFDTTVWAKVRARHPAPAQSSLVLPPVAPSLSLSLGSGLPREGNGGWVKQLREAGGARASVP